MIVMNGMCCYQYMTKPEGAAEKEESDRQFFLKKQQQAATLFCKRFDEEAGQKATAKIDHCKEAATQSLFNENSACQPFTAELAKQHCESHHEMEPYQPKRFTGKAATATDAAMEQIQNDLNKINLNLQTHELKKREARLQTPPSSPKHHQNQKRRRRDRRGHGHHSSLHSSYSSCSEDSNSTNDTDLNQQQRDRAPSPPGMSFSTALFSSSNLSSASRKKTATAATTTILDKLIDPVSSSDIDGYNTTASASSLDDKNEDTTPTTNATTTTTTTILDKLIDPVSSSDVDGFNTATSVSDQASPHVTFSYSMDSATSVATTTTTDNGKQKKLIATYWLPSQLGPHQPKDPPGDIIVGTTSSTSNTTTTTNKSKSSSTSSSSEYHKFQRDILLKTTSSLMDADDDFDDDDDDEDGIGGAFNRNLHTYKNIHSKNVITGVGGYVSSSGSSSAFDNVEDDDEDDDDDFYGVAGSESHRPYTMTTTNKHLSYYVQKYSHQNHHQGVEHNEYDDEALYDTAAGGDTLGVGTMTTNNSMSLDISETCSDSINSYSWSVMTPTTAISTTTSITSMMRNTTPRHAKTKTTTAVE